ncbi:MAG: DUF423 domain-containing protein [Rhodospirillaceae bacterium]|nr:DUF423 domain-containing protein [Rhodospirillales bacterium]
MRPWVLLAGLSGMTAVGMGAYAAHGLAGDVFMQALAERASHYQLVHALALLAADRLIADGRRMAHGAAGLFVIGTMLFCGSLYYKAISGGPFPVPMVTPAGGITFMVGWLVLALASFGRAK